MPRKIYVDLIWLRGGIIIFLLSFIIFLFLYFWIYFSFEVEGKVNSTYPSALYFTIMGMIIGALLIYLSFKEKRDENEDILKSLQKLNMMKEEGLISDDEYMEKKKEILSRL